MGKKNIYLHIGFGKTGTTSLQDYCYRYRSELLQKEVLYPRTGIKGSGHHNLAKTEMQGFDGNLNKLYLSLMKEIEESGAASVLISSENFSFLRKEYLNKVKDFFNSSQIKIIFYIRKQQHLIHSTYLEWQKTGHKYLGSIEEFYRIHCRSFDFMSRVQPFSDLFGEENISARVYDKKVIGKSVIDDFFKFLGLDLPKDSDGFYSNQSLICEFSELITLIDQAGISGPDRENILKNLVQLSEKFKPLSFKNLIDESLDKKIEKDYAYSNNKFAEKFLDEHQKGFFIGN